MHAAFIQILVRLSADPQQSIGEVTQGTVVDGVLAIQFVHGRYSPGGVL
jgi:hypothetical protein